MIIRHAEKHTNGAGVDKSVSPQGVHTKHELTVRGWLRAGALAPFFAPTAGLAEDAPISTPRTIFASAATKQSPSLRPQHTVRPLAELLGLEIDTRFACGQEQALAAAAQQAQGPVLIVWHHSHICGLADMITGPRTQFPRHWPDDRFDVVWVLDRREPDAPWAFSQVAQRLFAYDRAEAI
jgi:broad specificity phosphatase PhoE